MRKLKSINRLPRLIFVLFCLLPVTSNASLIYDFLGECNIVTVCTSARAVLILEGSTTPEPNTTDGFTYFETSDDDFAVFKYFALFLDEAFVFDMSNLDYSQLTIEGALPESDQSNTATIALLTGGPCHEGYFCFSSLGPTQAPGFWEFGTPDTPPVEIGSSHQWTPRTASVPEPSVIALFGMGLLGLSLACRKQKQRSSL